jgi:hypothetical protein
MVRVCGLSSLGRDRMQSRILVYTAMKLGCMKAERSSFQEGFPFVKLVSTATMMSNRGYKAYDHSDGWARF